MKLVCSKENFKKALSLVSKIVGSTTSLPILSNILLKTQSGQLQVFSTNLEIAVKTSIGAQIEENGQITVPAKTLTEYVNNLKEDKITMSTEKSNLILNTPQTNSIFNGLPAEDFPLIPEINTEDRITVNSRKLSEALSQVVFATAFSETQPELSGVLFVIENKTIKLAATDRYRLAEKKTEATSQNTKADSYKIIVPNRAVGELIRITSDEQSDTEILLAENQVVFRTPSTDLTSRLIEAQYPDYQHIIPANFQTVAKIDTQDLLSAVKLSGLFVSTENNNINLSTQKTKNSLMLASTSQKYGANKTQIPCEIEGEENEIIFNYRYLVDCLNHIKTQKTILKLIDSGSPALIAPDGENDYFCLVMPIRT